MAAVAALTALAVAGCTAATPATQPTGPESLPENGTPGSTLPVAPETDSSSIVSSATVGGAVGAALSGGLPEASGGPSVAVSGSEVFAAGGTVFLDIEPESGAAVARLLIAVGGNNEGHLEFDVSDAAAPYRLRGQVPFDVDAALDSGCVPVAAVTAGGAVGPRNCHRLSNAAVAFGEVQVTLSWDSDADLDLHVVAPGGEEIFSGQAMGASGGVLDFDSHCSGPDPRPFRNEHFAWAGAPPAGAYVVRVSHRQNCGAQHTGTTSRTNYVVGVYNHGQASIFSGTFTGPGDGGGAGGGREVTRFEVGGGPATPPASDDARPGGGRDRVSVLNPDGEPLNQHPFTLDLGGATAEVYVISTNTTSSSTSPEVAYPEPPESAASGRAASVQDQYRLPPRPASSAPGPEPAWVWKLNNTLPLPSGTAGRLARTGPWSPPQVTAGDPSVFRDGAVHATAITATARSVVTDGDTTVTIWVGDDDYGSGCSGAGPCVTAGMVNALADRFFRTGAANDIYDWVTAIFGAPWGPHSYASLIPQAAADNVHVVLYDISGDGTPGPGQCRVGGYYSSYHNRRRDPDQPATLASSERLIFFIDSALLATAEGASWEVTDRWPRQMLGTLAHELQHMIHFYQKRVVRGAASETWLNEMASEVAEDLVAEKMMANGPRAVAYNDPTAGAPGNGRGRLPIYNVFNDTQVTTWGGKIANYSIVYAMGAYLARTYGGAELFSKIVQSGKSGVAAVEAALSALGHDVSFADALADWGVAVLLSDNTAAPARYRYNPGTWTTSRAGGEQFRLGSINLYHYRYEPPDPVPACIGTQLTGLSTQVGPYLHSLQSLNALSQPPHSNAFATLGRRTGTVNLVVTAATGNRITVVAKE